MIETETTIELAPDPHPPVALSAVDPENVRLLEALIFASAEPVSPRAITQLLPPDADADATLAALRDLYAARGVTLAEVAGGWQFRTAPDLGPKLRRVIEVPRRLPRVAMETLAIVAYHQPVTRGEIEEIRGASLSQATLDTLLENNLIEPKGRRETPGRPTIWATTPAFLTLFGLKGLRDLPRREDLLVEPPAVAASSPASSEASQGDDPQPGRQMSPPDAAEGQGVVHHGPDTPPG